MKKHYDHIVVGGGISGLTAALLLARLGGRVLLLEKGPRLGGGIGRFRRNGIPFDTGFHFTGGLSRDGTGMLDDMLRLLGIREKITPRFIMESSGHRIAFPSEKAVFKLPNGINRRRETLKREFPSQRAQIDAYFDHMTRVCREAMPLELRNLGKRSFDHMEEDYVSLQQVLDETFKEPVLKALLSTLCMCHGSRPKEVSFADHCRIVFGLYELTARVENGGDAFVTAFQDAFENLEEVDVECSCSIAGLQDIEERRVKTFVLSDGSEITADNCILTIHPAKILELLPQSYVTPAFRSRIEGFEPTPGFFSVFGILNGSLGKEVDDSIFSIIPRPDINLIMHPEWKGDRPMILLASPEKIGGSHITTFTSLELSLPGELAPWQNTTLHNRGTSYKEYKKNRTKIIQQRIEDYFPSFSSHFRHVDSASMLTYRDYLHSPSGSAYGIKQKVGQFNLIGRLPLVNLYVAGQSAMLPGLVGSMTSALLVSRNLTGKNRFKQYMESIL